MQWDAVQDIRQRLQQGLVALQAQASRQAAFHADLAALRGHWMLQRTPKNSPTPFVVRLRSPWRRSHTPAQPSGARGGVGLSRVAESVFLFWIGGWVGKEARDTLLQTDELVSTCTCFWECMENLCTSCCLC